MRRILAIIATVCLILAQIPASAEGTVWRLVTEEGAVLTHVCYEPEQGDQYVAADNTLYEVASVSGETATVRVIGMFELPDVSWLSSEEALAVSASTVSKAKTVLTRDLEAIKSQRINKQTSDGGFYCLGSSIDVKAWIDE